MAICQLFTKSAHIAASASATLKPLIAHTLVEDIIQVVRWDSKRLTVRISLKSYVEDCSQRVNSVDLLDRYSCKRGYIWLDLSHHIGYGIDGDCGIFGWSFYSSLSTVCCISLQSFRLCWYILISVLFFSFLSIIFTESLSSCSSQNKFILTHSKQISIKKQLGGR